MEKVDAEAEAEQEDIQDYPEDAIDELGRLAGRRLRNISGFREVAQCTEWCIDKAQYAIETTMWQAALSMSLAAESEITEHHLMRLLQSEDDATRDRWATDCSAEEKRQWCRDTLSCDTQCAERCT